MITWKAIAIVGIWLSVGMAGKNKEVASLAFFAVVATIVIACN